MPSAPAPLLVLAAREAFSSRISYDLPPVAFLLTPFELEDILSETRPGRTADMPDFARGPEEGPGKARPAGVPSGRFFRPARTLVFALAPAGLYHKVFRFHGGRRP